MNRHATLGDCIQATARGCKKKSMAQLADELGKDDSMFYRMCNAADDGARFPAELLIPLMLATKDFSILEHIARRTGHLVIEIRKLRIKANGAVEVREVLHQSFVDAMGALGRFFKEPTPEKKTETLAAIDKFLGDGIAARRQVERWEQPELELD
jgi:hypothetical protein